MTFPDRTARANVLRLELAHHAWRAESVQLVPDGGRLRECEVMRGSAGASWRGAGLEAMVKGWEPARWGLWFTGCVHGVQKVAGITPEEKL